MASEQHVADYATDQIRGAGQVRSQKMFGEYAIYCDERVVALLCDNHLYIRPTAGGRAFIGEVTEAPPYPGAKAHFLVTERLDDREWLTELVVITAKEVPPPKPKKPKPAKKAAAARPANAALKRTATAKPVAKKAAKKPATKKPAKKTTKRPAKKRK